MKENKILNSILGLCIGDALGVPVEFKSRSYLKKYPVMDMIGHGTHNQPIGTWSDDSSLTLCLAESLITGYDLRDIASKFSKWLNYGYWTPFGEVFDRGITTERAIRKFNTINNLRLAGGNSETSNGNGSLMRILPIVFYVLKAVNLGEDTDTICCITGGLAGLYYGYDYIPKKWINNLQRKNDIISLCNKLYNYYYPTGA